MRIERTARRVPARRAVVLWGSVVVAALAFTGCSGGVSDAAGSGAASGSAVETDAMKPVTEVEAPTEAFTPPHDKHILILQCASTGEGCVNESQDSRAAAESLGWTVDVVDGKFDPTVWNQAVKQAALGGIDGIISISADPNLMAEAMEIVQENNIPFVLTNQYPNDSDIEGVGTYIGPDPVAGGTDIADWIIADSGGNANVLLIDAPGYHSILLRTAAIEDQLKAECPTCSVSSADMSAATVGTTLAPLVTSRLQQDPGITYIVSPDDCCVNFITQGVQQAGRADNTKVVSVGGFAAQLASIKAGGTSLVADEATPNRYMGWLSVDSLARLMAGAPTERYWAAPQRIWTKANLDEASAEVFDSGWNLDFDYKPMFQKMWGTE